MTMVNRMPKSLHTVVAPRYLTELEYGFTGSQLSTAGLQGYFNIWANGLWFPGEPLPGPGGNAFTVAIGADEGVGGVVYPATVALTALQPVGETMLASLYDKYRVHGSSIAVTCTPTSGSANAIISIVPISGSELLVAIPGNDIQRAQSMPRSKFITVSPNNNIKQNRISARCASHIILGMTKQQYNDSPSTAGITSTENPAGDYAVFWQMNLAPFSAGALTSCDFEIRVTYLVEFFDPLGPTDT